jgi:hypothetical protein
MWHHESVARVRQTFWRNAMSIGTGGQRSGRRWKRWLVSVIVLVAAGAVLWQGFRQYLQVEGYAPLLAAALTDLTGLPASVGTLDLTLFPTPQLTARALVLGEGDFRLEAAMIGVHVRLGGLLHRELDITAINAAPVVVHLPAADRVLKDRVAAVAERAGGGTPGKSESPATAPTAAPDGKTRVAGFVLSIRQVTLGDLSIYRGESAPLTGRVELRDLLTPKMTVNASASAPAISKDMDLTAALSIALAPGEKPRLDGTVSAHRIDIENIVKDESIPHTRIDLDLRLSGSLPDSLAGDLSGTLETDASESFSGRIGGQAAWKEGQLLLRNVGIESPGLKAAADISFTPGGPLSATVSSAAAQGEGLRVLLALVPLPGFHLEPRDQAAFTLAGLQVGPVAGGGLGLTAGGASFQGIDLVGAAQGRVLRGISGSVSVENNTFRIAKLSSEGVSVSGVVRLDLDARTARLELAGDADLAVGQIGALAPTSPISDLGGRLSVKRFAATITPGAAMPPDLELDGQLQDGRFTLATQAYTDRCSGLSASFGFKDGRIQSKMTANSERLGTVGFEGVYTPAEALLKGVFRLDMTAVAASFIPEGQGRAYGMPLAEKWGSSSFDLSLQMPGKKDRGIHLQLERQGAPALRGSLGLAGDTAGMALKQLAVSAEVPLGVLAAALPVPVHTEGAANVSIQMGGAEPGLRIKADMENAAIRLNEHVAKKSGTPAAVSVLVDPSQSTPLQSVELVVLGETITMLRTGGALRIPELRLNLAPLSPLLTGGGTFSGQVSGSVELAPVNATLHLDGAGVTLAPGVAIDSMTGSVGYRSGSVQCESLRVLGAGSDCTFSGTLKDRVLDASVTGATLNLDAMTAMRQAFAVARTGTAPGAPPSDSAESKALGPVKRITGKATVQLGALLYKRGRMEAVRAEIAFTQDTVTASTLAFQAERGSAQGTAIMTYGAPGGLDTALNLSGIDLDLVDRLFFAEPSGMRGAMSGPVHLRFPLAGGAAFQKGLNGAVDINAENGSYGKIRYATELLTVLKGTEIVRLTMPSLKDEGLTFKSSTIRLQIADGRIAVEKFTIMDNAYAIEGGGMIDLPADAMDVTLGFNPLRSVTGVADLVPGVKMVSGLLSSGTGLRIRATGSPFNPKVRPDAGMLPIRKTPAQETAPATTEEPQKTPSKGFMRGLLKPTR